MTEPSIPRVGILQPRSPATARTAAPSGHDPLHACPLLSPQRRGPVPSTRLPVAVAAAAVIALASAGCSSRPSSGPSTAGATGQRTINVAMVDNAYQPDTPITVATGDKVKFVFHNTGKLPHEAVLGDVAAQNAHEQEMAKPGGMGGMDHGSATPAPLTSLQAGPPRSPTRSPPPASSSSAATTQAITRQCTSRCLSADARPTGCVLVGRTGELRTGTQVRGGVSADEPPP